MRGLAHAFEADGRVWMRNGLNDGDLAALDSICELNAAPGARISPSPAVVSALKPADRLAAGLLPGAQPVRLVAFNKSEAVNWALPWHQDRVIAVQDRVELPGFRNWTRKSGVWHVEPPIELLARMIFLRIHLDPAGAEEGCLEIARGTHLGGLVADDKANDIASAATAEQCVAKRGDVLAAKALILHRSGASQSTASRRAIRIDYSADALPPPLRWAFSS